MNYQYYDIEDVEPLRQVTLNKGQYPKDVLNLVSDISNNNWASSFVDKNKQNIKGSLIGGGIMLILSLYYKKNIFLFTITGLLIGGLISNTIYNKLNKNNDYDNKSDIQEV